jgi:23S rRNA pseudouridine1911/1915/1917 synthase
LRPTLEVLFADNHLLVVAKPAGLPTVPDRSGDQSLLDLAREWVKHEAGKPGRVYLGVVHRLDRPVSGVLVLARTSKAAARLSLQFRLHRPSKLYWGIVEGLPEGSAGVLEQWLVKDREANRVHAVAPGSPGARLARTRWRLLAHQDSRALLELEPESGRPHQLRLACRSLGVPLCGDLKYGARTPLPDASLALHARRLELDHPTLGERLAFEAPTPTLEIWELARQRPGLGA